MNGPSRRKISRRDIRKPDQFLVASKEIGEFLSKHRAQSIGALALVLALLLGSWGWQSYRERHERLAAEEYGAAMDLYHDGRFAEAVKAFSRAKNDSSGAPYRDLSLLYLANSYIGAEEPAKAEGALSELLRAAPKEEVVRQIALLTMAYLHEKKGEYKEAAASYSEAGQVPGPFGNEALLGKARCSLETKDLKGALSSYRQYLINNPASDRAAEIALRIQEIEGKIGETPGAH